jgi:hypothetical protein
MQRKARMSSAPKFAPEHTRLLAAGSNDRLATGLDHARAKLKPITVPELVKEMVEALELDKRGDYHLRDMEVRLGRFAKDFPAQIADVTTEQIENWLRGLKSLAKGARRRGALKGRSRNNYRNAIVELFNCARKHGYLPRDLSTEAASVNRVSEADKRMNPTCSKNPPTPRPTDGNPSGAEATAGPNPNEAERCVRFCDYKVAWRKRRWRLRWPFPPLGGDLRGYSCPCF